MNFLAHCFLAQPNAASLVGNLLGDFTRGADFSKLPNSVMLGLKNHKAVDKFTDGHEVVAVIKSVTSKQRRRFSGIMADVTFDYFLCQHWQEYTDENLDDFVEHCYREISSVSHLMHPKMNNAMQFMLSDDGLRINSTKAGVAETLNRISKRIRFKNNFYNAFEEVESHFDVYEECFIKLFPELMTHIDELAIEV